MEINSPAKLVFPAIILVGSLLYSLSFFTGSIFTHKNLSDPQTSVNLPIKKSLSEIFPSSIQQWRTLIEAAAEQYNLDPNLIAAVMLQESGGNEEVISSSGAVGLMQVMPRDGIAASFICENRPCFINRPVTNELLQPEFNIEYGTRMLSALIKNEGSVREALYRYGPMDVGYYYADLVLEIFERSN